MIQKLRMNFGSIQICNRQDFSPDFLAAPNVAVESLSVPQIP
jgi:hypothetical protein